MILIADSGSTKTQWCLVNQQGKHWLKTGGLNPFFDGAALTEKEVGRHQLLRDHHHAVEKIFFYGAGCGSDKNCRKMQAALQRLFPQARVSVESDLLGAARGIFGDRKGIAGILGTGSNSGLYNGKNILLSTPSLGYILGDEGSGSHLGKKLLYACFHNQMPDALRKKFRQQHPESNAALLDQLYHHPFPNRFMAGFTPFIHENQQHPFMQALLQQAFGQFLQLIKDYYPADMRSSIRLTGSVAANFRDIIGKIATEKGLEIENIVSSPLEGLMDYHLPEG